MRVFLIGYMASGKTKWSKKLAAKLNVPFLDLDQEIEQLEGKSVSAIFEEDGESYFRSREREKLQQCITDQSSFVLSLGGGTPCFHDNMELIRQSGFSIYLDVSVDRLFGRLKTEKAHRPLLADKSDDELKLSIENSLAERLPHYQKADVSLNEDQINLTNLHQLVLDQLK